MATSRREPPHSDARTNRPTRNMSPVLKLVGEPAAAGQGLRRARSVPSSPDRKSSPSPASSSSHAGRPSPSFSARTGAASSMSILGKTKPGSTTRSGRAADKSTGGATLCPPALAVAAGHGPGSSKDKDMNARAAKAASATTHKSKLGPKPGAEKMAATSSSKLRSQRSLSGARAQGATPSSSSARAPGATVAAGKKKTGAVMNSSPSIQRTMSVPVRSMEAANAEEQEVELLMEFDDAESISTPSIEEHLQERLPDPVELKHVGVDAAVAGFAAPHDDRDEPCRGEPEGKVEQQQAMELISEEEHEAKDSENLNVGEDANAGDDSEEHGASNDSVHETEPKEAADNHETELKGVVSDNTDTASMEAALDETGLKQTVAEPELPGKEEAEVDMEKVVPAKETLQLAHGSGEDDGRSSEVKEEGKSKPVGDRKSKVMALIGRFETAMSGRE